MSALIIIIGILSVILAIATALIVGFSVANAYIYNQVEYSNNVGEGGDEGVGGGLAPTNEEAQDFVIIRESCEMTMDMNWYSKEIKNPVIKKNGEGISSVSGSESCVGDKVGSFSDADVDELFADFDK